MGRTDCCRILRGALAQDSALPPNTVFRAVLRVACEAAGYPALPDHLLVSTGGDSGHLSAWFRLPVGDSAGPFPITVLFPEAVSVPKAVYEACRAALLPAARKMLPTAKQLPVHLQIVAGNNLAASNLTDGFLVRRVAVGATWAGTAQC